MVLSRYFSVLPGLALAALLVAPATAAEFYKGKQVELTIGANPGGGYNAYARATARNVSQFIPGNPTIIPRNRGGAGSRLALNWMLAKAKRDGTVFGAFFPSALIDPLIRPKRSKYDVTKFNFLGSINKTARQCIARKDAKVKKFTDLFKHELTIGATARGGSTRDFAVMLNKILGTKFKVISGYKGSAGIMLAVERGEVQGLCGYAWSSLKKARPDWARGEQVNIFVTFTMKPHKPMEALGAEPIWKFLKTDKQRKILSFFIKQQEFGRPYVAPPDVPKDRVKILRVALKKTWASPGFLSDAKKLRLDVDPISGPQVEKLLKELYALPKDLVAEIVATTKKPRKKKKKKKKM
ncbi:MAG: tripartite tricarboxylate transporter substrate-binding protein [Alphaproteobacteria bacterium]|nr:tripartite tricarboxylate transporter substrate-binding protein [Alphaproteobacteria bacterium]